MLAAISQERLSKSQENIIGHSQPPNKEPIYQVHHLPQSQMTELRMLQIHLHTQKEHALTCICM